MMYTNAHSVITYLRTPNYNSVINKICEKNKSLISIFYTYQKSYSLLIYYFSFI